MYDIIATLACIALPFTVLAVADPAAPLVGRAREAADRMVERKARNARRPYALEG